MSEFSWWNMVPHQYTDLHALAQTSFVTLGFDILWFWARVVSLVVCLTRWGKEVQILAGLEHQHGPQQSAGWSPACPRS